MMLSTLLQCCIVIVMQIKLTVVVVGSGSTIQDRSDHGAAKEPMNPFPRVYLSVALMHHDPGSLILIQIIPKERTLYLLLDDKVRVNKPDFASWKDSAFSN